MNRKLVFVEVIDRTIVWKWYCSCGGANPDSSMFCQWCGA